MARQAVPAGAAATPVAFAIARLPPGMYRVRYQAIDGTMATGRLLRP